MRGFPFLAFKLWLDLGDDGYGCKNSPSGGFHGLLGVPLRVLLRGNKVHITVEGKFPLLPEPSGVARQLGKLFSHLLGESPLKLQQRFSHIVPFGRLHPYLSEHPLEGQLNDLLRFSHHIRVILLLKQQG